MVVMPDSISPKTQLTRTMLPRMLTAPLLLCSILLAGEPPGAEVLRPMMPAGCESVCRNLSGCLSCRYIAVDLSCRIHRRVREMKANGIEVPIRRNSKDNECQHKQMTSQCEDVVWENNENLSRMLILPREQRREAKVFYRNTSTLEGFPRRPSRYVTGMAYISKLRKLFMTIHYPYEQVLTDLEFSNQESLGNNEVKSKALVADNTRMIIFVKHKFTHWHISRFDIIDKRFRKLIFLERDTGGLVIDSRNQFIYVSWLEKGIVKYSYVGQFLSKVHKQHVGTSLYYQYNPDTLLSVCGRRPRSMVAVCSVDLELGKSTYLKYVGFDFSILLVNKDVMIAHQCQGGLKGRLLLLYKNGARDEVYTDLDCNIVFGQIP